MRKREEEGDTEIVVGRERGEGGGGGGGGGGSENDDATEGSTVLGSTVVVPRGMEGGEVDQFGYIGGIVTCLINHCHIGGHSRTCRTTTRGIGPGPGNDGPIEQPSSLDGMPVGSTP